ncbi:MAG: AMP-binding protein [Methanobrevibacter sp.]|jgi:non-ribosomal peptide synthetase component F|nr:AMP-binding protein [Candidatus Methanovirga basalitermitum]
MLKTFDEIVINKPQIKAIKYNDTILTYKELDILVNRIANLIKFKIRKKEQNHYLGASNPNNTIVPIHITKSHFTVASILAVWKLGLAYTAIDKQTPEARFKYLVSQIKPIIVIDEDFIEELEDLDEGFEEPINKEEYIVADDLACVIYTSGTTGTPKGVLINYKQLSITSNNILKLIEKYLTNTCVALIPSFSTIAANIITFGVILAGGYLHIIPDEKIINLPYLIKYIKENKITGSMFPPQLAEKFLKYADGLLQLLVVSTDKVSNIHSLETIILNLYGQSETLGFNTVFQIDKPYKDTPIGKPHGDVDVYLLDENQGKIKDAGVVGEIYVARQLAMGYLGDDKLTTENFIPNPYSESDEDKIMYKTGDLAYYNISGDLVYLQRKDFMINIHGYRVEPTEVENAINSIKGIKESVVAGFDVSKMTNTENDIRIYAGIVTENNEEIKNKLSRLLPPYMIPSIIKTIDNIPLNQIGKIDRKNILPENLMDYFLIEN